jgi:hypothetical protein
MQVEVFNNFDEPVCFGVCVFDRGASPEFVMQVEIPNDYLFRPCVFVENLSHL